MVHFHLKIRQNLYVNGLVEVWNGLWIHPIRRFELGHLDRTTEVVGGGALEKKKENIDDEIKMLWRNRQVVVIEALATRAKVNSWILR
jgi:hypothetical protein